MNNQDSKYNKFALVREMLETSEVIRKFDPDCSREMALKSREKRGLFFVIRQLFSDFTVKGSVE